TQGDGFLLGREPDALGRASLGDVGPPATVSTPAHGSHDAAAEYQHAQVPTRMVDELLQIDNALQTFQGVKRAPGHVRVLHTHHPPSFRAEERLDHYVAAQLREGVERGLSVLAGDR